MQHSPSQPSQQQSQAIERPLDSFKNQSTPALLQACGLHFHHPGNPLFTDFSATIQPGITLIKGGDGRGKSTLLRLLAGALSAQKGTLQIKGVSLHDQPLVYRQQVFWTESRSDAFDALTSNRPYREKITVEEAITYLHEQSGILFDPSIVEAFKKLVLENPSNYIFIE